jgi:hypothetical protein
VYLLNTPGHDSAAKARALGLEAQLDTTNIIQYRNTDHDNIIIDDL